MNSNFSNSNSLPAIFSEPILSLSSSGGIFVLKVRKLPDPGDILLSAPNITTVRIEEERLRAYCLDHLPIANTPITNNNVQKIASGMLKSGVMEILNRSQFGKVEIQLCRRYVICERTISFRESL